MYSSLAGVLLNVYLHCARECAKWWVERRTKNKSPPILAVDDRVENKWVRSYVSTKETWGIKKSLSCVSRKKKRSQKRLLREKGLRGMS